MEFEHLKLKATNHEQVDVISALLQDAIFHINMCSFDEDNEKCLRLLFNRFCWECEDEDTLVHYRVHTVIYIHHVEAIYANKQIKEHSRGDFLSLLGMHSTNENEIILLFSGNRQVKIEVSEILLYMQDINNPWPTYTTPHHELYAN